MKKFFKSFLVLLAMTGLASVAFAFPVSAQVDVFQQSCSNGPTATQSNFCKNVASEKGKNTDSRLGPNGIITKIAQIITYVTGAVSVVMIIIGGFRYVVSGGDSNGITGAKNTILYAVVGLVVTIFAQIIVSFVLSRL